MAARRRVTNTIPDAQTAALDAIADAGAAAMIAANMASAQFMVWRHGEEETDEYHRAATHYARRFADLADSLVGPLLRQEEVAGAAAIARQSALVMDLLYISQPAQAALEERAEERQN